MSNVRRGAVGSLVMRRSPAALVFFIAATAACGDDLGPLDVELDTGVVRGADDGNGVRSWLGIPYAAAPVGELRWKPPRRAPGWDGVREATAPGFKCPQNTVITSGGGAEDCLNLNVWTPSPRPTRALPVMVWIHGGAFVFGSGGDPFYAGAELARTRDVVVVTINYRLGGLGFLAHPALAAEDPAHPTSGNYGLLDQLAALEWVQRNIVGFGGDPDNVTLFGESAGGFSTCVHYASPATSRLFHRAIVQSGACTSGGLEQPRERAEADGLALAEALGCPGTDAAALACMRDRIDYAILDATALPPISQQPPGGFFYAGAVPPNTLPNIDGVVLPAPIEDRLAAGGYPARPLMIGTNGDEGTLFLSSILASPVTDEDQYLAALGRRFGDDKAARIAETYPVADYSSPSAALAEISGDAFFVCPARRNARAIAAAAPGAPIYRYTFERALEQPLIADLGAFHSAEIAFVFGGETFPLGKVGSADALSRAMQGYWTRFAATGDPNGGDAPVAWPSYDASSDPHLVLDVPVSAAAGLKPAICDFWDAL
jgi:para-nitrobenzyl esterase